MIRTLIFAAIGSLFPFFAIGTAAPTSGDSESAEAAHLATIGAFEDSVIHWKKAEEIFAESKDRKNQVNAQIHLAQVYYALGQTRLAFEALDQAQDLVSPADRKDLAQIKATLGGLYIVASPSAKGHAMHGGQPEPHDLAETTLHQSIELARAINEPRTEATALNSLGNLHNSRGEYKEASEQYQAARDLAIKSNEVTLAAEITLNLARNALNLGEYDTAYSSAKRVVDTATKLQNTHGKAYLLLGAGRLFNQLFLGAPNHDNGLRLQALDAYKKASAVGTAIGDKRALSYAWGYEGELYEDEKKSDDALTLTRQAAFLAQSLDAPDILYRWEWQTGRLLHARGDDRAAISAYRRAAKTLQSVRHDVALHYGNPNAHSSFRDVAGKMYFELADLLLKRADSTGNPVEVEKLLLEARDSAESLKAAELEDYFQDQCVNLLQSKITRIETVSESAAVVYIIPLPDRTEMLVSLSSGLHRVKSPATDTELTNAAHRLRVNLEKRTTYEFLDDARQLYDWLIKPLGPLLANTKVDTLVFIPDGALRNIPMGSLYDGQHYLIEKYAIAVTPGLTLMEPRPFQKQAIAIVANGLSDGVQGFSPLEYVPAELTNLKRLFGGTELMNSQFVKANIDKEFAQDSYSIVHIASHGHFDADAKKTFVLTFDGRLTLDDLEQLLRPSQLRDKPVELLSLSACQTAAGDDRAALGLAGVAIKAGARSAFATLWFVNDESSSLLVSDFYNQLRNHPDISKAKALQAAQLKLIADQRYAHPCYWAPYLIIGNWL